MNTPKAHFTRNQRNHLDHNLAKKAHEDNDHPSERSSNQSSTAKTRNSGGKRRTKRSVETDHQKPSAQRRLHTSDSNKHSEKESTPQRSAHHQLLLSAKATTSKDANKKSAHAIQQQSSSTELSTDTTYTRTHHNGALATSRADEGGETCLTLRLRIGRCAESDTKLCLQLQTRQSSFHPALKTAPSSHHSEREFLHTGPSTGLVMAIQKHRLQKP